MDAPRLIKETAIEDSFFIKRFEAEPLDNEYPVRLGYHRLMLIEKGVGAVKIDDKAFTLKGSELILMAKGQIYQFDKGDLIKGYILCFGDCFWERSPSSASNCKAFLFNNAAANQQLKLDQSEITELLFLFGALLQEYQKAPYTNQVDAMAAFLKIIMIKVANVNITGDSSYNSQDYQIYRNFMELLNAHFRINREVNDYAEMLGLTSRRLSDICKRCSNLNAKELINGQLIAEAKRLLQFSAEPIKTIAYTFNFTTPEQFSQFFKKNTGFSPVTYRKKFINIAG